MIQIPNYVKFILDILEKNGYEAYIVGGSVRDALRGHAPDDFDVTTNAEPETVQHLFDGVSKVLLTGLKHGTVTVLSDGKPVEVTTYRTDGDYKDNRHPENVTFVKNIDADLSRRDFTVNAMAYSPTRGLVDLYGGKADLKNHILRCVGNADMRFHEDALRILRALRFAAVLGFEIEQNTAEAIIENRALLLNVSAERIRTELFKLLCGKDAARILHNFSEVFFTIVPAWNTDAFTSQVQKLTSWPEDAAQRFGALLMPNASHFEQCKTAIDTLKTDSKTSSALEFSMVHANEVFSAGQAELQRALYRYGEAHLRFLLHLQQNADAIRTLDMIAENNLPYRISDLKIRGEDVAALGYTGKQIGEVLTALLMQVIDGKVENEKDSLLLKLKKGCV